MRKHDLDRSLYVGKSFLADSCVGQRAVPGTEFVLQSGDEKLSRVLLRSMEP